MAIEMMGNLTGYSAVTASTKTTRDTSTSEALRNDTNKTLSSKTTGKQSLDMNDFLRLISAQMQNQDMNNPMSESEMLAQMAQMANITAMNTMTDVAVTTYSASLVGKDVTLAYSDNNNSSITQLIGKVTGAGLYAGEQIIFVGGKSYKLSQIMAIGELPDADGKAIRVDEKGEIISKPGTNTPETPVDPDGTEAPVEP